MQTDGYVDRHRIDSAYTHSAPQTGLLHESHGRLHASLANGVQQPHDTPIDKLSAPRAIGMMETAAVVYRHNGISGFFKGLILNLIKGPVTISISFTTFDICKTFLDAILETYVS